ncbi:MAG: DUF4340 domain-containing protein, partial [Deltaproteobacteria bacterium]|nr:DUF4340 domain-containing protein [Deltaproteobacteria bacterium]
MKKEYIILFLIILALVLYLFLRDRDRTHYQLPLLTEIPRNEISMIEIIKPDTTIVVKRKDKDWAVTPEDYPANNFSVESMLGFLEKPVITAMVSESKNYERYGLDENKKITVKAYSGDTLRREVEIGNTTPAFQQTFIRLAGDYRVYHGRENLRHEFDRTVDELRDKIILSFQKEEINKIEITRENDVLLLTKKAVSPGEDQDTDKDKGAGSETVWVNSDGDGVDESELDSFLATMSNLSCNNYIYDIKREELTDPLCVVKLEGEKEYVLSIFPKKDINIQSYPSLSSENDYPFMLIGWKA